MGCRRGARRLVVGVGLLVPGLLLIPVTPPTDAAPAKPSAPEKPTAPAKATARPTARPPASARPLTGKPAAKARTAETTAAAREGPDRCVHVVKSGDSVARVATRYKVTRQAVLEANRLGSRDILRVGQRLQVPGCTSVVAEARVEPVTTNAPFTATVGPRKVPTRLFLGTPDLDGRAIDFTWPVIGNVVSGVGRRRLGWHAGIDIQADVGTPVQAAASGTVYFSGWERAYGRVIKVEHDNGFASIYAHNLQNFVEAGDRVDLGQVIATVGRSGRSTAYHLHFEIRHEGTVLNPLFLLPRRDTAMVGSPEEMGEPLDEEEDE
jgi:LysM repeat protein